MNSWPHLYQEKRDVAFSILIPNEKLTPDKDLKGFDLKPNSVLTRNQTLAFL